MVASLLFACLVSLVAAEGSRETAATSRQPGEALYRVLFVGDTDSIVLAIGGRASRAGLLGVGKPKTDEDGAFHLLRQRALRSLVENEAVRVRFEEGSVCTVEGSPLVHLYRDSVGLWINLEVVARGYGTATDAYEFDDRDPFQEAESEARAAERGVWSTAAMGLARDEQHRLRTLQADALERSNQLYNVRARHRRERRAAAAAAEAASRPTVGKGSCSKGSRYEKQCKNCGQDDCRGCNDK